jgi:hypothetical protein
MDSAEILAYDRDIDGMGDPAKLRYGTTVATST